MAKSSDPLAMAYVDDILDDDEFYLLMIPRDKDRAVERTPFTLDSMSDAHCKKNFRFKPQDLRELCDALRFPVEFVADNRSRMPAIEGLCLLLRRLVYPVRLHDLEVMFGREMSVLSRFFNIVLDYIFEGFVHLLTNLDQPWLTARKLQDMADANVAKGCPFDRCVGFIDGTNIKICRPSNYTVQEACYSGYTSGHDLKYSGIMSPCGIFMHVYGPSPGRNHDLRMLFESELEKQMEASATFSPPNGPHFYVYGDQAYVRRSALYVLAPFKGNLTEEQILCNKVMSSIRISVEWGFGKIAKLFAFTEFYHNQKLFLQPLSKYYLVCALLTNCHTCVYGSLTSDYFQLAPPNLREYLSSQILTA